jgi:transposase, IS6 family
VIVGAVRCYLRYCLSYRDVEELLVERGIEFDHVTIFSWVQRFTPLLADAARSCRPRGAAPNGVASRQTACQQSDRG